MPKQRPIVVDDRVHEHLRLAIEASPLSITWLAGQLGRDRTTLYKWLDGTNAIPPTLLERLCQLLDLPKAQRIAQFVGRGYSVPRALLEIVHHLRAPLGDFVGRAAEIADIVAAFGEPTNTTGPVTICGIRGMGGVGKTELAMVAAQQLVPHFPDGQVVLSLRGAGTNPMPPTQALQTILRAFDLDMKLPDDLEELQGRYRSYLHGKRVLILADDAADAAQVRPLLPPSGCGLLITSRQRFVLPSMLTIDLDVLPASEAERLLRAICPRLGADAPRLAKLCGYLPLALRISASLLAANDIYPIRHYLAQLTAERLAYLRDPDAEDDDPQASVEASLALSYRALDPIAQDALSHLSVFPVDFDRPAALAVLALAEDDADLALGRLRWRSLLEWDAARARFWLHDLVRAFAAARPHDHRPPRRRHAEHFRLLAERMASVTPGARTGAWFQAIDQELDHLRAALGWLLDDGAPEQALRMALALEAFWLGRESIAEGARWLNTALARVPAARTPEQVELHARALSLLAELTRLQGDFPAARELYRRSGDLSLYMLEDEAAYADALFNMGMVAIDQNDHGAAQAYLNQSLELFQEQNRPTRSAAARFSLGRIATLLGDVAAAERLYTQSAAILRATDDREQLAWLLIHLAWFHSDYGAPELALRAIDESIQHFTQLGHSSGITWAVYRKSTILADQGRRAEARAQLHRCLAHFELLGNRMGCAMCHNKLTSIALADDDFPAAWMHATRSLEFYQGLGHQMGLCLGIEHVAMLLARDDAVLAARLFGYAEARLATLRHQMPPIDRPAHDRAKALIRAQLGDAELVAVSAEGQALAPERAVELAMQACGRAARPSEREGRPAPR